MNSSQSPPPQGTRVTEIALGFCVSGQGVFRNRPLHWLPLPLGILHRFQRISCVSRGLLNSSRPPCVIFGSGFVSGRCESNAFVLPRAARIAGVRHCTYQPTMLRFSPFGAAPFGVPPIPTASTSTAPTFFVHLVPCPTLEVGGNKDACVQ